MNRPWQFPSPIERIAIVALSSFALLGLSGCGDPVDRAQIVSQDEMTISFFIEGAEDIVAITHSGAMPLKQLPADIQPLQPTPAGHSLGLIAKVRDGDGAVIGFASELEDFPIVDEFNDKNVWDTYWTVVINGRGSLLLYEKESLGPEVGSIFSETHKRTDDWTGNLVHASNVGPAPSGLGVIVGGTGEFSGADGTFEEIGTLRRFTPDGDIDASIELRVKYTPAP